MNQLSDSPGDRTRWPSDGRATTVAIGALFAVLQFAGPKVAVAQAPDDQQTSEARLEEVIVTARRRTEGLQQTPIAISAYSAEEIELRSIRDVSELANFTPSMHQTPGFAGGNSNTHFFIRGVGQVDNIPTYDPRVGLYLDGVYIARSTGNLLDVVGIEQIDVLRGPQGTLFGRNSMGGAVMVTTKRPTGDVSGSLELTAGRFDRLDVAGALEFPVVDDQLAASVMIVSRNQDGYGTAVVDGRDMGDRDVLAGRVSLNWYGSDTFNAYTTIDATRRRENTRPVHLDAIHPVAPDSIRNTYLNLVADGASFDESLILPSKFDSTATDDSTNDLDTWGASFVATWDLDGIELKSITAYRDQETVFGVDQDGTFLQLLGQTRSIDQNQLTQELQLTGDAVSGRLSWVLGAFYLAEESTTEFDRRFLVGLFDAIGFDLENFTRTSQDTTAWAGFAHAEFAITDRIRISGGIRYNNEEKDVTQMSFLRNAMRSIYRGADGTFLAPNDTISAADTWSDWTPRVALDFQVTENTLLYASYSRGFNSGGFDGRPINNIGVPNAFEPEELDSYEVGAKLDLIDNRLRLNVAAYRSDYTNMQVTNNRVDPVTSNPVSVTINAAEARIDGAELEAVYVPADGWRFSAAASFTDIEFEELPEVNAFPKTDKPPNIPEAMAALSGQYTHNSNNGSTLTMRVDLNYQDKYFNEIANGGVFFGSTERVEFPSAEDGYTLLNARISYTTADDLWVVSAFGTNITDERYRVAGFTNAVQGYTIAYYGPPSEWGVSLERRF